MSKAVVILNYNNYEESIDCVESMKNLNYFEHIIVVDNASSDMSFLEFKKTFNLEDNIIILSAKFNGGYATGNNIGLRYASEILMCKQILVCNPDVRINNKESLEKLSTIIESSKDIVSASLKMSDKNGDFINNAWKIPTYGDDLILSSYILTKIFGDQTSYSEGYLNNGSIVEVDILAGSCFLIKTDFLKKNNYLDEGTFLYGEERILGKRIKDLGLRQILYNDYSFIHFHSTTISKNISSHYKRYIILSESRYYYQKKYNNINLVKKIFLKLFMLLGSIEQIGIQIGKNIFK